MNIKTDGSANFSWAELACRCGCRDAGMETEMLEMLEKLRGKVLAPLSISSGYRCPAHNAAVSPATGTTGPHTTRQAVDIRCSGNHAHQVCAMR